jgi:FkbM family methyltransferase
MASQAIYLYRRIYQLAAALVRLAGPGEEALRRLGNRVDGAIQRLLKVPSGVPNPLTFEGHRFYHGGLPSWTVQGMFLGTYEQETLHLLWRLLKPGMTFVDLGAHIGCYTVMGATIVGETGRVYAFEPCPENADLLARNVVLNGHEERVRIVRKAVADTTGEAVLMVDVEDTGSSSMISQGDDSTRSITVPTTSLDEFFAGEGWPKVDLVKMDIEGAEIAALRGMAELSRRNPDLKLIVEFSPKRIAATNSTPADFFAALQAVSFSRFWHIGPNLVHLAIPRDIDRLVRVARYKGVNLLCLK